jgi:hypothetical protein
MAAGLDVLQKLGLKQGGYATLTMHRPSNVDDKATPEGILGDSEKENGGQTPILPSVGSSYSRIFKRPMPCLTLKKTK